MLHYVRGVDEHVELSEPEAMVYELTPNGLHRLVGVEYVVPEEVVEAGAGAAEALPEVLGERFHKHSSLPLYILHAWIWEANPDGMFNRPLDARGSCSTRIHASTWRGSTRSCPLGRVPTRLGHRGTCTTWRVTRAAEFRLITSY